jgi:hypothetical protein
MLVDRIYHPIACYPCIRWFISRNRLFPVSHMAITIQEGVQSTSLKPVYMATTMEIDPAFG